MLRKFLHRSRDQSLPFAPLRRSVGAARIAAGLAAAHLPGFLGAAPALETLVNFVAGPGNPQSALVQGADGNFYGTTANGGASASGTIFRLTPAGASTTLVSFTGNGTFNRGANPAAALLRHSDGNFYGTTAKGGAGNFGTVFRVTPAGTLTTLVDFTGFSGALRGSNPLAALVLGVDGNFYGTTELGGANGFGTLFRMTPAGAVTTLVDFAGTNVVNGGAYPSAALVRAADGSLWGTTRQGGGLNYGTVFRVSTGGALSTVAEFNPTNVNNPNRGAYPAAPLIQGRDGAFYGTTREGGRSGPGFGTVFRVSAAGAITTLSDFTGNVGPARGAHPAGALVQDSFGDFYGTTYYGGANGIGVIYRLNSVNIQVALLDFTGNGASFRGANPAAGLVLGTDGFYYGATAQGGASDLGTLFRVNTSGALTTLGEFTPDGVATGQVRGTAPNGLVQGADGLFYGSTNTGGARNFGTVFRVSPAGALITLADFYDNGASFRGILPVAAMIQGDDGDFYGPASSGGSGRGALFRLSAAGALTTLLEFTGSNSPNRGSSPAGSLVQGSNGDFYGATSFGGPNNHGTLFRTTPAGVLTTLVEFTSNGTSNRGAGPQAALVEGGDGNFYGVTPRGGTGNFGTLFRLSPAGALTTLVDFTGNGASNRGAIPSSPLVQGAGSDFYGTTSQGGSSNNGTVFRWSASGTLTTLVDFTGNGSSNRGTYPFAALVRGPDGNFYGSTSGGSTGSPGTLFRVSPAGALTTLVDFTGLALPALGATPAAAVVFGRDGNFYGTTRGGGTGGAGTIFRLRFGPTPLTAPASALAPTGATLHGSINPNGAATTFFFEFGLAPDALTGATPAQSVAAGSDPVAVSSPLAGLRPGTVYHFRLRGENAEQFQAQRGEVFAFLTTTGPALVSVAREAGSAVRVRWQDLGTGTTYRVEFADHLASATWQSFPGTVTSGQGGAIEFLDPDAPSQRFYRLVSTP